MTIATFSRTAKISMAVLLLFFASCSSDATETSDSSAGQSTAISEPAAEESADTPDLPTERGDYAVGRTQVTVDYEDDSRSLEADVWFPASPSEVEGAELTRYSFLPTAYFDSTGAYDGLTISDDGPFPLLAFSHGNGGISFQSSFNMEHLASYGFVVIAVNHKGNTAVESVAGSSDPRDVVAINRPQDISAAISSMIAASEEPGVFEGAIDADRIGVFGHSFGGYTALTVAGGFGDGKSSVELDDRVDAIIGLAPSASFIPTENLQAISVPTLLMVGTEDETTPMDEETDFAWDNIDTTPAFRINISGAGHQTLSDVCDYVEQIPLLPDAPEIVIEFVDDLASDGCGEGFIDFDRAKDIINGYTTAFFMEFVALDDTYAALLNEDEAGGMADLSYSERR